jgi:hypothetical protein
MDVSDHYDANMQDDQQMSKISASEAGHLRVLLVCC